MVLDNDYKMHPDNSSLTIKLDKERFEQMDATDNPGTEIPFEDSSDEGIGASADESVEYTEDEGEAPDINEDPIGFLESQADIPDDLRETLKQGFLRQADYTRKTQALATERRRLEDQRAVVDQLMLSSKPAPEVAEVPEDTGPPDVADGASPQDVINYYVNKAVQQKLDSLGIAQTAQEMQPVVNQQRVVRAYQSFAAENPDLDHKVLAAEVGRVLASDPDLGELAEANPLKAVRLAAKVAKSNMTVAKSQVKSKKRRDAAPVASRKGTVVRQKKRETALEAATRALKEQGINV